MEKLFSKVEIPHRLRIHNLYSVVVWYWLEESGSKVGIQKKSSLELRSFSITYVCTSLSNSFESKSSPLLLFQRTSKKISVEFPIRVCRFPPLTHTYTYTGRVCQSSYHTQRSRVVLSSCYRKFSFSFFFGVNGQPC